MRETGVCASLRVYTQVRKYKRYFWYNYYIWDKFTLYMCGFSVQNKFFTTIKTHTAAKSIYIIQLMCGYV